MEGIREVFHAHFTDHAYPLHTHETWALLIVDHGAVRYILHRHDHGALRSVVTVLPPHVAHDGSAATSHGFRKRVVYLDSAVFGMDAERLIGPAVDRPSVRDVWLCRRLHHLHTTVAMKGEGLAVESELALVVDRLRKHLRHATAPPRRHDGKLARVLRELLDARVVPGVTLEESARQPHTHRAHLVRTFGREYGAPPHRCLTQRRIELARRHILAGSTCAEAAASAGFYDQAHLTRHFTRLLGVTPSAYARGRR